MDRSTLRGVVALVSMMGAAASVPAMGQHPEGYGMQEQRLYAPPGDGTARLCSNVLMTYPSDHLLLTVKSNPAIQIHCGEVRSQMPVVITFESMRGLDWYRTHAGHREIRQGEGPKGRPKPKSRIQQHFSPMPNMRMIPIMRCESTGDLDPQATNDLSSPVGSTLRGLLRWNVPPCPKPHAARHEQPC